MGNESDNNWPGLRGPLPCVAAVGYLRHGKAVLLLDLSAGGLQLSGLPEYSAEQLPSTRTTGIRSAVRAYNPSEAQDLGRVLNTGRRSGGHQWWVNLRDGLPPAHLPGEQGLHQRLALPL